MDKYILACINCHTQIKSEVNMTLHYCSKCDKVEVFELDKEETLASFGGLEHT